jgi:hypothetical protein
VVFDYRKSPELIADIPGRLRFLLDACLSSHKDKDIHTLLPIKVKPELFVNSRSHYS